ncbi:hypothetical protein [Legionella tunisiensis]|uniref:hypothetical protein n=1 Tax=Legionella tunisiensis TaxID=1034944 RepID=UPI00035CEECB|nr:hypothetical protein [Legionella tunisiensis]
MTNVIEIYEKIRSNYETFLDTQNAELLATNIGLYEQVDRSELKSILATGMAPEIEQCNQSLLIIGKSYTAYALAMQTSSTRKECFQHLREANECYNMISKYAHSFPSSSITSLLSNQLMEATFRKKRLIFAKQKFSFILLKNLPLLQRPKY